MHDLALRLSAVDPEAGAGRPCRALGRRRGRRLARRRGGARGPVVRMEMSGPAGTLEAVVLERVAGALRAVLKPSG